MSAEEPEEIEPEGIEGVDFCRFCGSREVEQRARYGRSRGEQREEFLDLYCSACGQLDIDTEGGI